MLAMETFQQSIYDFPEYYDLVYGSDWEAECRFLKKCFQKFAFFEVVNLFEPACGTGRLLYRLGQDGFGVSGIDLNEKAVSFCNSRLQAEGIAGQALVGDMTDFSMVKKADASFNTINSFRHLGTHELALRHLQCMAGFLRQGGLYVIGLHLTPTAVAPSEEESWIATTKDLQVNTRMWLIERNLEERFESFAIHFEVYTAEKFIRIEDELVFRTYTRTQFDELLSEVPEFEVAGTYDFAYNINRPIHIDEKSEDVVYVLRKK